MTEATDQHIGTRVRIARTASGLTQVEMAGFLGRSEHWVQDIERGRLALDRYSVISSIADLTDVDVVWLLGQPYRLRGDGGSLAHAHIPALRTGLRRAGLVLSGHPGLTPQGTPWPQGTCTHVPPRRIGRGRRRTFPPSRSNCRS